MSEEGAALDARKPFRAQATVSFDGFSGREQHGDVLVYPKGLLLRTRYLKPVGTGVEFEIEVESEADSGRTAVLRGRGLVVFSRWQDQGQRRPAGLGVRIEQLDDSSRQVLQRLFPPVPQGELLGRIAIDEDPPPPPAALESPEPPMRLEPLEPLEPSSAASSSPARSTPSWLSPAPPASAPSPPLPEIEADLALGGAAASSSDAPRAMTATVGGWREPPPALPNADGIYATTSRRWLEASAAQPVETGDEAPEQVAEEWPVAPADAPRLEFAAHAESRSERPRLVPWIFAGVLLLALLAGGYWAYSKYFAAPGAPGAAATSAGPAPTPAPAPQRLPAEAPGSTLVDDVLATTGAERPAPAAPPSGAETSDEPPPAAAPAAVATPFSRLVDIRWEPVGPGGLRVTLLADGPIPPQRLSNSRLDAPPRQVLRLRAPVQPFGRNQLDVGDPLLSRIRLGAQSNGDLQIVLDLGADAVRVAAPRFDGERVEILLSR